MSTSSFRTPRARSLVTFLVLAATAVVAGGCATVKPQDRAILADPTMTYGEEDEGAEAVAHAIENREGSIGGATARGGGCGCN